MTKDIEKQYNYARVKVSRTNDVQWVRNVITDMLFTESNPLTGDEFEALLTSLEKRKDD